MADPLDPIALNVTGVSDLVESRVNKVNVGAIGFDEGVEGEKENVLTLKLDDEELLELKNQWEKNYAGYEAVINRKQKANLAAYLGKQAPGASAMVSETALAGNYLFEAEETFLASALAKNPDPVVYSDNTPQGNDLSNSVQTMLQYHADQLAFRRKLTIMVRQWSIYHLGVIKYGWDEELNDITVSNRKIEDFIFDVDGHVDAYGCFTSYLGERITVRADKLVELFPKKKAYISEQVEYKMGTMCTYTEWWTDKYTFCTFKEEILDKSKNSFFKYDEEITADDGTSLGMQQGKNHFAKPAKPYTFLSVFTLGGQPHDITGLIEQNIPNQNLVTKRTYQIDRNLSRQNNSIAYSENNFTQETAKQAAGAFEKGNPVLVPQGGPIAEAIQRFPAEGFPDSAFKEQETNIQALRSIFGTLGTTAQPPKEDTTARGMILNQQYDNTRIGGGIGDAVAQVADNAFNWLVQLYYVFYDDKHFAAVMGQLKSTEYITLRAQDMDRQFIVTVAPDSMQPHDHVSEMNEAIQLFQMGAIGPKTLLNVANFPNVDESAQDGVLWHVDPNAYLQLNWPQLAQQLQQIQQQAQQAEAQAQQQQMAQQGQAAGQQMQIKGAQAQQGLQQKEAAHQQKLKHGEQTHQQKLAQTPPSTPATTGGVGASASLKKVPLPK